MTTLDNVTRTASRAGGQLLGAATRIAAVRPAAKPLHPRGTVLHGTLHRFGNVENSRSPWLDEAGDDPVLVRWSRSLGLPRALPDVLGLAIRVQLEDGHGDLLFSTTGHGPVSRFVLTPARTPYGRTMTTLLPYRTPVGPVLLAAQARDDHTIDLAWARGAGRWHPFAELVTDTGDEASDAAVSFDPVLHEVPGLRTYGWVRCLREPAYVTARRSRGA